MNGMDAANADREAHEQEERRKARGEADPPLSEELGLLTKQAEAPQNQIAKLKARAERVETASA